MTVAMGSVLTRRVFRQILLNEPLIHQNCLRPPHQHDLTRATRSHRRTLFGFGRAKSKSEPVTPIIDPGLAVMVELNDRMKLQLRPHPREDISDAFKGFVASKKRRAHTSTMTDLQVEHCLIAFDHLQKTSQNGTSGLELSVLETALRSLVHPTLLNTKRGLSSDERRLDLARQLYSEAIVREKELSSDSMGSSFEKKMLYPYLKVLGMYGRGAEAMVVLDGYWQAGGSRINDRSLWNQVIRGTARADNQEELERILSMMVEKGVQFNAVTQQVIVETLGAQDALSAAQLWYLRPLANGETPSLRAKTTIIELCMKHGELEFGQPLITSIIQDSSLTLEEWNIIFAWAIATGKGVEEVDRLIEVMQRRSGQQGKPLEPDASTINCLVKVALWQNNGYLAERILNYGRERNIKSNAATWIMQVEHRLNQGDLQGAVEAYDQVRSRAYEIENDEDASAINRLVTTLSQQERPDMNQIMVCVSDLTERKLQFEPATVAALATAHMRRDELHDAIDLMRTYAKNYDHAARSMIRDKMVAFCLQPKVEIALAWDAYIIVHELFNETSRDIRETIMTNFFERGRPDMAVHVFGHMRQYALPERRPSARTYQKCFEGVALAGGDEEILDTVHNMLKLDYQVDPDTRLYNALMMAQTAALRPEVSLGIWKDITQSEEGPTYESIRIALMACEMHGKGETEARKILERLDSVGVEVTKDIYTSYLWALAGQGKMDEARDMVDKMSDFYGSGPDAAVLGIFHNIVPLVDREEIIEWAMAKYPEVWEEVESKGMTETNDMFQIPIFDIDRGVRS